MNLSKASIKDVLASVKQSEKFLSRIGIDISNQEKCLSEALAEKDIDVDSVLVTLKLLNEVGEPDVHWLLEPTANLVKHITTKYHNRHRVQLPRLISLAEQVEHINRDSPCCPLGLADYLRNMYKELLAHMESEEQILFPFLVDEKKTYVFTQVSLTIHNHDHEVKKLADIDELTNGLTPPKAAGDVWEALYVGLKDFKQELMEHVRLENDILFNKVG